MVLYGCKPWARDILPSSHPDVGETPLHFQGYIFCVQHNLLLLFQDPQFRDGNWVSMTGSELTITSNLQTEI